MRIWLGAVSPRRGGAKSSAAETMLEEYIRRAGRLASVEAAAFDSEEALLHAAERSAGQNGRPAAYLALFDSRGEQMLSTEFAQRLGQMRDASTQRIMFAIGPADGWSAAALDRADWCVSLGRMTLPHELARVVAAEQIYRALTILAGHPYHCGH